MTCSDQLFKGPLLSSKGHMLRPKRPAAVTMVGQLVALCQSCPSQPIVGTGRLAAGILWVVLGQLIQLLRQVINTRDVWWLISSLSVVCVLHSRLGFFGR